MNFEMTGKLSIGKDSDKFHPYTEKTYPSGWAKKQLLFNVTCGDNRHMLSVTAGAFADGHGDIYSFTKGGVDENGNRVKGESIQIPFKDRLTSPKIAEIAEFKKFIFDLEKPGRRYKLQNMADKIHEGNEVTDEELKEVGLESKDEVATALEKSNKKRHEFISEWDYIDFIKKVIASDKYKDKLFFIRGNGEYQYSDAQQKVYESYIPNRIYLAADDAEPSSTATINIIFNKDSLDDMSAEEKGKYYVNGYMMEYDQNRKGNIPVPVTITIPVGKDEAGQKWAERVKHKFIFEDDDESFKEYGAIVNMLNGAQRVEIDEDMLTDEEKEDIKYGLTTLDDIRRDLGGSAFGERIREYQFVKPARGFTRGREDTAYTEEDMIIRPIEEEIPEEENLFEDEVVDTSNVDDGDEL